MKLYRIGLFAAMVAASLCLSATPSNALGHDPITIDDPNPAAAIELGHKQAVTPTVASSLLVVLKNGEPESFGGPIVKLVIVNDGMTKAKLVAVADAERVQIGDGLTKAEIINAIAAKRAPDNPGPRTEELE